MEVLIMSTRRHGEEENRESFKLAKEKADFEKGIDTKRAQVAHEKEKKEEKRFVREEERREKEIEEKE